jgi:amino acid adenylation domain-containing protein
MMRQTLHGYLLESALRVPDRTAIEEPPQGAITYAELARLSGLVRDRLRGLGVRPGDRVGLYVRKSIDTVASVFGILRAGAAYVPVDPGAPASRNAYIMNDCSVAAVLIEDRFVERFRAEMGLLGPVPSLLVLQGAGRGDALRATLAQDGGADRPTAAADAEVDGDDLAYILYTSGSTGRPKGVMLSHRNATSFVDWGSEVFEPTTEDRFSSHAPLHFDLSILDLYVPIKHGAAVVLVGEDLGKDPVRLAAIIAERRLTVWYSAPSILSLLAQHGKLDTFDYSALRLVLFAGEVFPVKHLRSLASLLPRPRYFNLYGPTETNVCTFYEVSLPIAPDRVEPFAIGRTCSHLEARVVDTDGKDVAAGQEGELCIAGAGVMRGYWNLPERNAAAFLVDAAGRRWYRTGDVVVEDERGDYRFRGRRDRMVKRRGYRIELGEIEAALYRHPEIKEAAVVAQAEGGDGVRIKAFLSCRPGQRPSLIELKRFSSEQLPLYMIPDAFVVEDELPKTSTDKIDYQRLKERA